MMGHDKLEKKLIPLNSGIRGQSEKVFWIPQYRIYEPLN